MRPLLWTYAVMATVFVAGMIAIVTSPTRDDDEVAATGARATATAVQWTRDAREWHRRELAVREAVDNAEREQRAQRFERCLANPLAPGCN